MIELENEEKKREIAKQKRAFFAKKRKLEESMYDLLGVDQSSSFLYAPSKEQVLLTLLYEILLPIAHKSGKNVILLPKNMDEKTIMFIKKCEQVGLIISFVETNANGAVEKELLEKMVSKRTLSFICPSAHSKTSAIHNLASLGSVCSENDVFFFCDVSQSAGKMFFQMKHLSIDMLLFSHQNTSVYAIKNRALMMKQNEYSLDEYAQITLLKKAKDLIDRMDQDSFAYSERKKEITDHLEALGCNVLNKGSAFLADRVCFRCKEYKSENIAYYLTMENIAIEYTKEMLMMKIDLDESDEQILQKMEIVKECIQIVERIHVS